MKKTADREQPPSRRIPSVAEMERRAIEWARKYPEAFAALGRT